MGRGAPLTQEKLGKGFAAALLTTDAYSEIPAASSESAAAPSSSRPKHKPTSQCAQQQRRLRRRQSWSVGRDSASEEPSMSDADPTIAFSELPRRQRILGKYPTLAREGTITEPQKKHLNSLLKQCAP